MLSAIRYENRRPSAIAVASAVLPRKQIYRAPQGYQEELATIDRTVLEEGSTRRLFDPSSVDYETRFFDLTNQLRSAQAQGKSLSVWDIGAGPIGRHIREFRATYPLHQFFGVSPWVEEEAFTRPYDSRQPLMAEGLVEELDFSVLPAAIKNGVKPPDILLASNVLRHTIKNSLANLLRSFEAMENVLRPGGKVLIYEESGESIYRKYQDFLAEHHLAFSSVQKVGGNNKRYLELTRVEFPTVMNDIFQLYLRANLTTPMAPPATDIPLSSRAFKAVAYGEWSMAAYADSVFNQSQLREIGKATTAAHIKYGIPFVVEGFIADIAPDDLNRLRTTAATMLAKGTPLESPVYRYDARAGIFMVSQGAFNYGWDKIRERGYLAALDFMDAVGVDVEPKRQDKVTSNGLNVQTPENTQRISVFFTDPSYHALRQQFLILLEAAGNSVNAGNAAVQMVSRSQRREYNLAAGGEPQFRVTAPLLDLIAQVEAAVCSAWGELPKGERVSLQAVTSLIDNLTRRNDQPKD